MSKKNILFTVLISLLIIIASCKPEEEGEPRTRETEWEELDAWMKRLEDDGEDIDTTDLAVFYIVRKKGDGPFPKVGDNCTISYLGFLPGGKKIEDSNEIYPNGKWSFVFKPQHVVEGLNNAIGYMNKGAEIEMYIHSDFAYGSKGTTGIPPFTTLVYRVTMHEMIPKN
ncbi:FKBP-type peptidyl-prolyl cis-trans isomerase [Mariniphaga sp.]|uniref:FKBP-type peptidyl-prolyl cis-trans isomerase n=1 Tax=Mariniphaga sp. TaxID=1954475 RepID=UPI003569F725